MNSLNRWCQAAVPVLLLVLGIEGLLFSNDVETQRKSIQSRQELVQNNHGQPVKNSLLAALERR